MLQIVADAFKFALEGHVGQQRKDGSTPYIVHPFRVFLFLLNEAGIHDETVLAAAFLHDLIEDTDTDYDDLNEKFGNEIADIVAVLSKDKRLPEKTREQRFNKQLANASWKAKIVKLADIYDNLCDMQNWNPPKSKIVSTLREKLEQVKFLRKNLPNRYRPLVKRVLGRLNEMQMHVE